MAKEKVQYHTRLLITFAAGGLLRGKICLILQTEKYYPNMENRKEELYSQVIPAGKRRYFFDVKETRGGDKFITVTESRKVFDNKTGEFYYDKSKIFLYKEDFEKFQKGLANALSFIETGIEPEPVVVENEYRESDGERREQRRDSYDDFDLKY